jgi:hypothetical protein
VSDDDLEEINLAADHTGSARRIRAGRKNALRVLQRMPLWKRQLGPEKQRRPITLAGRDQDK